MTLIAREDATLTDAGFLALAREMIRRPSVTSDGTIELATFLRDDVLAGTDLEARLEPGTAPRQVNLVATKGIGPQPPILLNSHLDTVPPGDPALWNECNEDPFAALMRDGRLFGLGSADAKLDWLCKATALLRFRGRRFRRGVIFVGTFGEEHGMIGARALLDKLPARPIAAWAGEPSELELVTRHKGFLALRLRARDSSPSEEAVATTVLLIDGRSAHSSTPHLGENAIGRALEIVGRRGLRIVSVRGGDVVNRVPARCLLEVVSSTPGARPVLARYASSAPPMPPDPIARARRMSGPSSFTSEPRARWVRDGRGRPCGERLQRFVIDAVRELTAIGDPCSRTDVGFNPPHRTANVGKLDASGSEAELVADVRPLPGESSHDVLERLERFVALQRSLGLDVSLVVERNNPPLDTPADAAPVVWSLGALAACGRATDLRTKSGCTEAGVYSAAGIPSVVIGPGISQGNVHAPNEHVTFEQLSGAVEFYTRLVADVCIA